MQMWMRPNEGEVYEDKPTRSVVQKRGKNVHELQKEEQSVDTCYKIRVCERVWEWEGGRSFKTGRKEYINKKFDE